MNERPRGKELVQVQNFKENHLGMPGQAGPVDLVVTTVRNERGQITEIRANRQGGYIPSMRTNYVYEGDNLTFIENHLYGGESPWAHLVELVDVTNGNSAIVDPDLRDEVLPKLKVPRTGELLDFSALVDKSKSLNHPALKVVEDKGAVHLIRTVPWTVVEEGKPIVYAGCSVWSFSEGKDKMLFVNKVTRLQSLWSKGEWNPGGLPETKELVYDEEGVVGTKVYKGEELLYHATYSTWHNPELEADGQMAKVFDVMINYGEFLQKETGEKGKYYAFEDLLDQDLYGVPSNYFGARIADSIPLLERKVGDVLTRIIDFPTIPGKQIKVELKVVAIGEGGRPEYEKLSVEVVDPVQRTS